MNNILHENVSWLELLNSDWHDFRGGGKHEDRLDREEWLNNFLLPWQGSLRAVPMPEIRDRLRELRVLLRRMAENFSKRRPLEKADFERLNRILENSPQIYEVSPSGRSYKLQFRPHSPGIRAMLAEIAVSFAEVLAHGEPGRVKVCRNPDCLWIFYDRSKNRSRKWCENASGCGNLMKVRQFRAKRKN